MSKKKVLDEPAKYFPNGGSREFRKEQLHYIQGHIFVNRKRGELPQKQPKIEQAKYYLKQITEGWRKLSGLGPFNEEKDKYVIEAIKLFSASNSLSVGFPAQLTDEANQLGGAVCRVLGHLRQQALTGGRSERQIATMRIKNILKSIIPESRGKRKEPINPFAVKYFYYQELFRLYHIKNALKSSSGSRRQSKKVKQASKNYGMPKKSIREFWGLDDEDMPDRQPFTIKDMARELTARHYKVTHQTVSNLLSR